jgi:predicted TPR repeat methyltransferase
LRRALAAAGLEAVAVAPIVVRSDDGAPVHGQLFTARPEARGAHG